MPEDVLHFTIIPVALHVIEKLFLLNFVNLSTILIVHDLLRKHSLYLLVIQKAQTHIKVIHRKL